MTAITNLQAGDIIYGSFEAYWEPLHPTVLISFPNRPFDPEDLGGNPTDAYVRLYSLASSDEGNVRQTWSSDPQVFKRSGILTVEIYTRVGQSTDLGYSLADDVQTWLEKPAMTDVFFNSFTGAQEVGPDGTWFQIATAANWSYFTDRAA